MEPRPKRTVNLALAIAAGVAALSVLWLVLVLFAPDARGPFGTWDGTCGFGSGVEGGAAGRYRVARAFWALAGLLLAAIVVAWAVRRDTLGCLFFVLILAAAGTSFVVANIADERCINWND